MPLGITSISTSKLFSSLKIMWPSYPCKLWKIIGNFLGILNFKLHLLCAAPLNLPVTWQWSFSTQWLFSTHLINLLIQSLPLKIIEGKVNLSSIHTNFAPIELGIFSWYFIVCSRS